MMNPSISFIQMTKLNFNEVYYHFHKTSTGVVDDSGMQN